MVKNVDKTKVPWWVSNVIVPLVNLMLAFLVCIQVYLGDKLVWIYGLHTVPVVNAIRDGVI